MCGLGLPVVGRLWGQWGPPCVAWLGAVNINMGWALRLMLMLARSERDSKAEAGRAPRRLVASS